MTVFAHPKPAPRGKKPRRPLRRKTHLRSRRPGPPRRSSRIHDPKYLEWVREQRCCVCMRPGWNEASHVGHDHGRGQKCHDRDAVPHCRRCHDAWHGATGAFKGWTKLARRFVAALWVGEANARYEASGGVFVEGAP